MKWRFFRALYQELFINGFMSNVTGMRGMLDLCVSAWRGTHTPSFPPGSLPLMLTVDYSITFLRGLWIHVFKCSRLRPLRDFRKSSISMPLESMLVKPLWKDVCSQVTVHSFIHLWHIYQGLTVCHLLPVQEATSLKKEGKDEEEEHCLGKGEGIGQITLEFIPYKFRCVKCNDFKWWSFKEKKKLSTRMPLTKFLLQEDVVINRRWGAAWRYVGRHHPHLENRW